MVKPTELMEFPIEARNEILRLSAELAECRAEIELLKSDVKEWRTVAFNFKKLANFIT